MTTRRDFLKQASLLGAGLTFSPFLIQASNSISANDKIQVALIGCNGMGFEDLKAFLRNPEVECIALCDIDENVLNNRAAETEKITGKKVKHLYKDWRKVIDNKDVDGDQTYMRLGFKGETQVTDQLTGYGQWEYQIQSRILINHKVIYVLCEQYREMAINCFRYLGFTSFEQVDQLTIAQYEIMMDALDLRMLDQNLHEHRQAFLNFAVQAEKKVGKNKRRPVYRKFIDFFDYDAELKKMKQRRAQKKKTRFAGIGKLLKKGE